MLKILLCDDDPFFLALEQERIHEIIQKEQLGAAVVCGASSGMEALTFLKGNPDVGLAFLDIDFGQGLPNGIDISRMLRREAPKIRIVFTTNHQELAMDVLKGGIQPYGFLEKGCDLKAFAEGLRRYLRMALLSSQECGEEGDTLRLTLGTRETVELRILDILYLEAEKAVSHGITYHTINGSAVTVIGSLEAEEERLGPGFWRVHRSYLVAKKQILGFRNGYLVLSDQREIPCAFRMRTEVRRWLCQ
ncbi:MAG: response regulator transcription factor [Lachnospiraceae bacterium]|nr:response regulator transcription factor [Lachnospiraceae bacterium]